MKVFIFVLMLFVAFVGSADAQRRVQSAPRTGSIGSGNMATTQRYYAPNGRQVLTERKYSDRSYFYSGKTGLPVGQKVNTRK